jgi:hypothetical protein
VRPSHTDRGTKVRDGVAKALQRVRPSLPAGRRPFLPATLVVLVCALGLSTLVASAAAPRAKHVAAVVRHPRPNYLRPMGSLVLEGLLPPPTLSGDRGATGVPPGTPNPPTTPNPGAAAQSPAIAPYQGAPGTLTPVDIATLALERGCSPDAAVPAAAIAMAESGGSPSAQGDIGLMTSVWDWSAGLWQIRGLRAERNTGALRDSVANQHVDNNATAMYLISSGCADWTPWSTYDNGEYLQYWPLADQAVRYAVAYYNSHGHHYPPVSAPDPTAVIPSQGTAGNAAAASAATPTTKRTAGPPQTRTSTQGAQPPATASPTPATSSSASHAGGTPPPTRTTPAPSTSKKSPPPIPTTLPVPLPTLTLPTLKLPTPTLSPLP